MPSEFDRIKGELIKFIRKQLNAFIVRSIDHLAGYQCVVISQNSDGTLELQPDDPRLPPYSKVPIRYGIPKVQAIVNQGSRVLLEFANGDRTLPIATVWEISNVSSLFFGDLGTNVTITGQNFQLESSEQSILLDGGELIVDGGGGQSTFSFIGGIQVTFDTTTRVILPDGTKNVNRAGDGVTSTSAMSTWMSQVTATCNSLSPGSVTPSGPSGIGITTGGNPKVQA